jgi:hypothetical protein
MRSFVARKPDYKLEDTYTAHDWQKTYAIHLKNQKDYGTEVKPILRAGAQQELCGLAFWINARVDRMSGKNKLGHSTNGERPNQELV